MCQCDSVAVRTFQAVKPHPRGQLLLRAGWRSGQRGAHVVELAHGACHQPAEGLPRRPVPIPKRLGLIY
jgi:hypothetical protein